MLFRNFLKKWFGYTRRERTGSMVLVGILFIILVFRSAGFFKRDNPSDSGRVYGLMEKVFNPQFHPIERIYNPRLSGLEETKPLPVGVDYNRAVRDCRRQSSAVSSTKIRGVDYKSTPSGLVKSTPSDQVKSTPSGLVKSTPSNQVKSTPSDPSLRSSGFQPSLIPEPVRDDRIVDINHADSAELESLPGIGPVLAARIIKYRYLLGFFADPEQLNDVYGLDEDVVQSLRDKLICDRTLIRSVKINSASYKELIRHPYINRRQVETILSYRRMAGRFTEDKQLIRNRIFTEEELNRLRPYILYD